MKLTNIDKETIELEPNMIKEMHRRGSFVTEVTTIMGDKLIVTETPADILKMIMEERGKK